MQYPYADAIVMNDTVFQKYGGLLADTLPDMRKAAYQIAEQFVSEDLETYLLPTIITGTYNYSPRLLLENTYVNQVYILRFFDLSDTLYWTISGTSNIYASLRNNGEYGIVDLHQVMSSCGGCMQYGTYPYKIQAVHNAGLSSGTSSQSRVLMALTMASKIMLNEMIGFGNEAPGDIGVQSYSNQNYRETRVALLRTAYGTSAQAQMIHKLLSHLRLRKYVAL
jgi:hypothetical protein